MKNPNIDEGSLESLNGQKVACEEQIKKLEENKNAIALGITEIDNGITSGKQQIADGKAKLEAAKKEITNLLNQLRGE